MNAVGIEANALLFASGLFPAALFGHVQLTEELFSKVAANDDKDLSFHAEVRVIMLSCSCCCL